MKKVTDIQEIAEKVLKGSLSRQDGAWLVIEFIYTNKKLFRLNYITEDEVHDLILNSYEKFIEIFDKYKIQEGPFINYIYKVTAGLITLWRRSKAKKNINRKSLYFIASSEYDEKFDKYQEKSFSCACPDSDENTQEELSRYKKISKQLSSKKLYGKTGVRKRDAEILGKKYEKLRREAGIILALKSSYFLDENMIKKVSFLTGIPEEQIKECKQKVLEMISKRIEKREKCIKSRNDSYFFHNRYMLTKDLISKNTALAQVISRKYLSRTESWNKKNRELESRAMAPVPSNRIIAEVTGTSENHVSYILNQAKKNMDNLKISRYNQAYDNIFGKRKHEQEKGDV